MLLMSVLCLPQLLRTWIGSSQQRYHHAMSRYASKPCVHNILGSGNFIYFVILSLHKISGKVLDRQWVTSIAVHHFFFVLKSSFCYLNHFIMLFWCASILGKEMSLENYFLFLLTYILIWQLPSLPKYKLLILVQFAKILDQKVADPCYGSSYHRMLQNMKNEYKYLMSWTKYPTLQPGHCFSTIMHL